MRPIVLLLACMILSGSASAEVITIFDANDVITSSDTYDTVVVKGDGTVVDMTGGTITKLIVMDSARINISDGTISLLFAYDFGYIYASGGSLTGQWKIYQNAEVQITGMANAGWITLYQSSFIIMNSSAASISSISFRNTSRGNLSAGPCGDLYLLADCEVYISGSDISSIKVMLADMNVQLTISDGSIGNINFEDYGPVGSGGAKVRLLGGVIQGIDDFASPDSPIIEVVGYDLSAVPYGGDSGNGTISGNWNDDTFFQIQLGNANAYSLFRLYDGVLPEDCNVPPESDTNNDCAVNMIDFQMMASEWLDCGLDPQSACP